MNDGNFPWMPEGCVDDDENNDDDDENNDDIVGCTVDNDNDNDDVSDGGRTLLATLCRLDVHDDSCEL